MNVRTVCILTSVSPMFLIFIFYAGMFILIVCFCSMFFKFCTTPQFHPSMYPTFLSTLPSCSPPSLHRMQYAPICLSINALFAMRMTLGRGGEWTTRSLWDDATWVAADPENTLIPTFLPHSKPAVRFITFLLIFFLEILFFHNHALDTTCMARKILHACVLVVHAAFVFSNPFTFTYRHF